LLELKPESPVVGRGESGSEDEDEGEEEELGGSGSLPPVGISGKLPCGGAEDGAEEDDAGACAGGAAEGSPGTSASAPCMEVDGPESF